MGARALYLNQRKRNRMNVYCFSGNVTKDIQTKTTPSGKAVCNFSVALNEGKDKTTFINCVAWDKTAELISQYVQKGDRLSGTGRLDVRSYDKDGEKRYVTEVVITQFDFPPKRNESEPTKQSMAAAHGGVDSLEDDSIPF